MRLSSRIDGESKLEEISIKVGKPPVVSPFNRCIVTVGGSAYEWNVCE